MAKKIIIKGRLNAVIAKYGKVQSNGIRFLLFLSILLLGACTGTRTMNGLRPLNQDVANDEEPKTRINDRMHDDANTKVLDQSIGEQGKQDGFCSTVCREVKKNFFTVATYGSYLAPVLAPFLGPFVAPYIGSCLPLYAYHLAPHVDLCEGQSIEKKIVDVALPVALSCVGASVGACVDCFFNVGGADKDLGGDSPISALRYIGALMAGVSGDLMGTTVAATYNTYKSRSANKGKRE